MPDQVPEDVKNERSRALREEAAAGVERLLARHMGGTASVVWESHRDGIWRGLTDTNVRVYGTPERATSGCLSRVRLDSSFRDGLWAEVPGIDLPLTPVGLAGSVVPHPAESPPRL